VTGASVAVGPLVGGVLTDASAGRRSSSSTSPVGIARSCSRSGQSRSPTPRAAPDRLARAGHLLGRPVRAHLRLIRGNTEGWGSTLIVVCFVAAVVLRDRVRADRDAQRPPMLDLRLFRKPAFVGASVAAFVLSAVDVSRCSST
jgi:hypothetical protein